MTRFHAIVSGLVQGVNFRHYAAMEAKALALDGFVRNLPDGSVEVVAQGMKEDLLKLAEWLKLGPSSSRVENVSIEWQPEREKFNGFSVKY